MNAQQIEELVSLQRTFFETGTTLSLDFRLQSLKKLHDAILRMEPQINAALQSDLGKSATETYMCETGMTLSELSYMRRHLRRFAKDRHVLTPLAQFPSDSFVVREPYGVALIMSPWNYPFMLLMEPLIGALAAGNLLHPQAVGIFARDLRRHPRAGLRLLPAGIRRRRRRRTRRESGTAASAI